MNQILKLYFVLKRRVQYHRMLSRLKRWINNGLQIGENVTIMPTVTIDNEYSYLIKIGNNCSLSHGVRIIAHDATTFKFTDGHTRLGPVVINDNVFIGDDAIILPGITIGQNVIIAAGSVVNKDISQNSCIAGVPARRYGAFDDFINNHLEQINSKEVIHYQELNGPNCLGERAKIHRILKESKAAYVKGYAGRFLYTFNGSEFN